ncbi:MAG: thiamine phosphate synthase [Selenomonas sp.]|jgi:thiamine-phosphate pyrophosphorylase|nr:thiamine phosphate synthase [Selenomonas sp.]
MSDWSKLIVVTNRQLCEGDFLTRLRQLAARRPRAVILREKDLTESQYEELAAKVLAICRQAQVPCILHSFPAVARRLGAAALHLPLPQLRGMAPGERQGWSCLGTSCHSLAEVREAAALGCHYVVAGHIFATDCKRGLPGRGTDFLRAACETAGVPVFAIGGITPDRLPLVLAAGAGAACVMSGMMRGGAWLVPADVPDEAAAREESS